MDYPLSEIRTILSTVADFALHELPKLEPASVRTKYDAADYVSNRDYAMEKKIVETIHEVFPEHTVISEEIGTVGNRQSQDIWLVDPIDGSCNDSHGIPWCCVSVAYVHARQIVAGLIVQPDTREVFQAIRGQGATLNGERLQVDRMTDITGGVVLTELMNQTPWPGMFSFMTELAERDVTIRIMGSSALAITQVAAGRTAAAVLGKAGALDVAASLLIASEAGAQILHEGRPVEDLPFEGFGKLVVSCPGVASVVDGIVNHQS